MSSERVSVEVADHVATVTLTRADKHNALDAAMIEGIFAAAAEVSERPGVRAVVLHGDGPSFCSGLDIASLMGDGMAGFEERMLHREDGHDGNVFQRIATDWIDVPVPVIAAVHGNCFGGGMQIALGADIRIVAPDAKLSVMEVKWGLVPDMGITQTLPRLMPADRAKELTFTGRVVDGEEAVALGLATRVAADPLAAAHELAAEIASRSPDAIRAGKQLYDRVWGGGVDAREALVLETDLQLALIGSPNQLAAVTAGMTKQPAAFTDPAAAQPV